MTTHNEDGGKSFFAQFIDDQKKEELNSPAQKLFDWLQHDWTGSTISAREIYRLGPNSIRDRKSAIDQAEILVEHGRLIPMETRRPDMKKWQIVRGEQSAAPRGS
jgi:hypothetical protein